ncbi:acyl-CoA dehydrogenase family protein [Novosphingobium sp.]|uniref:acyl-CoA dehydrogenase family protein n=1 Tax=Novosphingobium sp. TaxID=1874826 RepID=UPI0025F0344C|nr:acyl-CoA dehydrogenase family protein [Novosphingobium sp.]
MSILYDEGQQAIATESRRVLDARMAKDRLLALLEQTGEYDRPFWGTAVEQGWTALAIPEEHGGLGLGLTELGLVAQAVGAATAGAPFLTTGYGAARALIDGGDAALAAEWLPRLANGYALAVAAFGEASSPLPSRPMVAFADGKLTGSKPAVPGGFKADVAVVWANAGREPVLVLCELADATRRVVDSFDNSRLYADLTFSDSPAKLLARGDAARALALDVLARMAVVTAHEQVGGAEALLYTARDYALTRKAFGQPIGAFQSVKHRIAEMYGLIEIARANCIHAGAREGQDDFLIAAADTRLSATEAYDTCARDCVQVHGGIGVTWEAGIHLHIRRTRALAIEQGNMLFWEDLLAERLTGVAA